MRVWKTKARLAPCWIRGQRRAPPKPGSPARWTCEHATGLSSLTTCVGRSTRFTSRVNLIRASWNAGWVCFRRVRDPQDSPPWLRGKGVRAHEHQRETFGFLTTAHVLLDNNFCTMARIPLASCFMSEGLSEGLLLRELSQDPLGGLTGLKMDDRL